MEYWKPIKGYPNYEVSSLGNVRSLNWHNERIVKNLYLKRQNKGYLQVEIVNDAGKKCSLFTDWWQRRLSLTRTGIRK